MVRSISNNYLQAEGGYPVQFVVVQPDSDVKNSLFLNTSSRIITEDLQGYGEVKTYPSAGILDLTAVEETKDVKTNQITVALNGVPNTIIPILKKYNGIGGIVTIYQGWMNDQDTKLSKMDTEATIGTYIKWKGVINSHSVDEENQELGKVKISLECKNILGTIIGSTNGRFTSDSSFKRSSSGDRSMEFVAAMATFNPKFGKD
jgi:hypothetical protein